MKLSISLIVILSLTIMTMVGHSLADGPRQAVRPPGRVGSTGHRKPVRANPSNGFLGGILNAIPIVGPLASGILSGGFGGGGGGGGLLGG